MTRRTLHMLSALQRNIPLLEPMDAEQIDKIDRASMDILEEVRVIFGDPKAIDDWRRAGPDVRADSRVHLDREPGRRSNTLGGAKIFDARAATKAPRP